MKWQPISTAPKDGSTVMVYPATWNGQTASMARWEMDEHAKNPRPYWRRGDDMGRVSYSRGTSPTHWMPLPAPPTDAIAQAKEAGVV